MKAAGLGHRRDKGRHGHNRAARSVHRERLPSLAGLDPAPIATTLAGPVSGVRCPGMDVRWRGMVIGCLNSGVGAGFGAAGKAVAASNSGILPPSPRTLQELFSLPLVLISDSFPGMGTFRVLTAAEQVGEYLRAELCRGAW